MNRKNPYPDKIFGGINHPTKGARYHREHALGIHHFSFHHPNPAVLDEPILSWVSTSANNAFKKVTASYTLDDWKSTQYLEYEKAKLHWDTVAWTWQRHWQAKFPALKDGQVLRYRVYGTLPNGKKIYADNQATSVKKATQFAIWADPNPVPPEWSKTARVYQIFVDRFNRGNNKPWLQTENIHAIFGGDLRGITEKLDTIHDLGFNTLWLTPIFKTPSTHGYDTTDYEAIDPRFGTKDDLKELINTAHAKGMRVLLDFVANHASNRHPIFQRALADSQAPERDWFRWKRWPTYHTFARVKAMPKLNLDFGSPAHAHLLKVAQEWLKLGVDGYRLDHANGPDRAFWVDFRRACREVKPDVWLLAEVVMPPDAQASYLGSFDGTLDFMTNQALRESFARHSWDIQELANYLQNYHEQFPENFSRGAFIDNHDMNRFLFAAQGNQKALHAALSLLYLMPGQPIVYAGTEQDISQNMSIHEKGSQGFDECRHPMEWSKPETQTAGLIRKMATFREANPWLADAEWKISEMNIQKQSAKFNVFSADKHIEVSIDLTPGAESVSF